MVYITVQARQTLVWVSGLALLHRLQENSLKPAALSQAAEKLTEAYCTFTGRSKTRESLLHCGRAALQRRVSCAKSERALAPEAANRLRPDFYRSVSSRVVRLQNH